MIRNICHPSNICATVMPVYNYTILLRIFSILKIIFRNSVSQTESVCFGLFLAQHSRDYILNYILIKFHSNNMSYWIIAMQHITYYSKQFTTTEKKRKILCAILQRRVPLCIIDAFLVQKKYHIFFIYIEIHNSHNAFICSIIC